MAITTKSKPKVTSQAALNALVRRRIPPQGMWSEADYLWLTDQTNQLIELTDGFIEELPMPSNYHQRIVAWFHLALVAFCQPGGGTVLFAPLRLRLRADKFREPDVLVMRDATRVRRDDQFWTTADLVIEIVSPRGEERDFVVKRQDYAEAGISEYWIVDPKNETITVLGDPLGDYQVESVYRIGETAISQVLVGFAADVRAVFDYP